MCHVFLQERLLQPSALPVTLAIENKKITHTHSRTYTHTTATCRRRVHKVRQAPGIPPGRTECFFLSLHFTSWSPQPLRSAPPRDSTISAVEFTSTVYVWLWLGSDIMSTFSFVVVLIAAIFMSHKKTEGIWSAFKNVLSNCSSHLLCFVALHNDFWENLLMGNRRKFPLEMSRTQHM